MNNAVYQHLFDSIINEYLIQKCGQSLHSPSSSSTKAGQAEEGECIGLIVQTSITYLAQVVFPEIVRVGVRVLPGRDGMKEGGSSVTYECAVFGDQGSSGGEGDKPRAIGRMTHVFVNRESRRPMKGGMPKRIRQGLEKLQVFAGDEAEESGKEKAKI